MQAAGYETSTVALSAIGAATSLGALVQCAAAARAGLVRARELAGCVHFDEETQTPVPVIGHPASWLTDGFEGLGRLVQLGLAAVEDLLASAPQLQQERLEWFLCLPRGMGREDAARTTGQPASTRDGAGNASQGNVDSLRAPPLQVAQWLVERIQEETGLVSRLHAVHYFLEERGGTVRALSEAAHRLHSGRCDHALVLACDSLVDPERAERLLSARRLKTADYPVGFMPGEAGVAVLLERVDTLRRRNQRPLGLLFEPVTATEPNSVAARAPPSGRVLADVLTKALARAGATDAAEGSVYLDLNGETFRASEWGYTLLRTRKACKIENWSQRILAMSFGETGTASPLLALCVAARAFARGYSRGRHALLLVSGDDGHRAGLVLEHSYSAQARSHRGAEELT